MVKQSVFCLVGNFPPPVHGASLVNAEFKKRFFALGANTISIDLSASSLNRKWLARLSRLWKFVPGLALYIKTLIYFKAISIYIGLSGGYGQIYDFFFIVLARLFNVPIFLDHQSYAYVSRRSLITHILLQVAGSSATHIVLCEDMNYRLKHMYGSIQNVFLLSNVAIVDCNQAHPSKSRVTLKTIAFFGNIAFEKGILEFLAVVERLVDEGIEIRALISGPFQDQEVEVSVLERLSKLGMASYVGSNYGDEKAAFYQGVDTLVFPTKYVNEAEPLTIHEAMSYGIPVIAWERGCIKSILSSDVGLVIERTEDFISRAVEQIKLWHASPQTYQIASNTASKKFFTMRAKYSKRFDELLSMMIGSSSLK